MKGLEWGQDEGWRGGEKRKRKSGGGRRGKPAKEREARKGRAQNQSSVSWLGFGFVHYLVGTHRFRWFLRSRFSSFGVVVGEKMKPKPKTNFKGDTAGLGDSLPPSSGLILSFGACCSSFSFPPSLAVAIKLSARYYVHRSIHSLKGSTFSP